MEPFESALVDSIIISPDILPRGTSQVFPNSAFFTRHPGVSLPSLLQVLQDVGLKDSVPWRPKPVIYFDLGLLIKFGTIVTEAEGQCLWALRHLFPQGEVPVPEIYGWGTLILHNQVCMFIYMELVNGRTLERTWPTLSHEQKTTIALQLGRAVLNLRRLVQDPKDHPFIGHIDRQALKDVTFQGYKNLYTGPFPNLTAFHDLYKAQPRNGLATTSSIVLPFPTTVPSSLRMTTSILQTLLFLSVRYGRTTPTGDC